MRLDLRPVFVVLVLGSSLLVALMMAARRLALLILLLLILPGVAEAQRRVGTLQTVITLGQAATGIFSFAEIVGTEAGIQQGSISEANRWMPDGKSATDTAGRAFIKAGGTTAIIYITQKTRYRHPTLTAVTIVGVAAWNGYLTKRSFDYLRRGQR